MFDKEYIDSHYTYKIVPLLMLKDFNREIVLRELMGMVKDISDRFGKDIACEVMDYWTARFKLGIKEPR